VTELEGRLAAEQERNRQLLQAKEDETKTAKLPWKRCASKWKI
jgi:hypothetical protein